MGFTKQNFTNFTLWFKNGDDLFILFFGHPHTHLKKYVILLMVQKSGTTWDV